MDQIQNTVELHPEASETAFGEADNHAQRQSVLTFWKTPNGEFKLEAAGIAAILAGVVIVGMTLAVFYLSAFH